MRAFEDMPEPLIAVSRQVPLVGDDHLSGGGGTSLEVSATQMDQRGSLLDRGLK